MARPLRVCITTAYDLAEEGGVKRHAEHLAAELRSHGDEVLLVGPYSGRDELPHGMCGLTGVYQLRSNGSNCRPGILVSPLRVWRLLRRRFDVVHVMEPVVPSLNWYAAWFGGSAVRVATFHSYSEHERPWTHSLRRRFGRLQLALFDRGIAVSAPAEHFVRALWSRHLALIPNGVDTGVFAPARAENAADPTLRLLFVGHWHNPRKGLPTLLRAYAELLARGIAVRLDIIGDGDPRHRSRLPGITYHAAISDERQLAARYRAADVFVAPSLGMESFGIVLLEAMASGRPIVCSDIDGYRSVAPREGAHLVRPGDSRALAAALAQVGRNHLQRRRMAEVNRAAALGYDWSVIAARVRDEYLAALDERRHASQLQ